ncbi:MAG: hypothetical protein K2W85_01565, partial [Phycisphaerales bacterium]|nr:hypothetical protein [Phycisphaerales bacterium]
MRIPAPAAGTNTSGGTASPAARPTTGAGPTRDGNTPDSPGDTGGTVSVMGEPEGGEDPGFEPMSGSGGSGGTFLVNISNPPTDGTASETPLSLNPYTPDKGVF